MDNNFIVNHDGLPVSDQETFRSQCTGPFVGSCQAGCKMIATIDAESAAQLLSDVEEAFRHDFGGRPSFASFKSEIDHAKRYWNDPRYRAENAILANKLLGLVPGVVRWAQTRRLETLNSVEDKCRTELTFPVDQARGKFIVRFGANIAVPRSEYEYLLELAASIADGSVWLSNQESFACEGKDPDDRARHYAQSLRENSFRLNTGHKSYALLARFDIKSLPPSILSNPNIDVRIRNRLRSILSGQSM